MSYEYDEYGNPQHGFNIDDVDLIAEEEVPMKERVEVPEGTWNMQVIEALPKAYYDKTDINNEQIKRLIPLEVIDEGPYQGAWAFMSVYMAPDNPENQKQMTKYKMGRKRMAMVAKACGMSTVADINDCAGNFIRVTLVKNGTFTDITDIVPFKVQQLQEQKGPDGGNPLPKTETVTKDEIPF